MKIKHTDVLEYTELPMQCLISFEKVYSFYKKYADKAYEDHQYHNYSKKMLDLIHKNPVLIDGFSDFSLLNKYEEEIDLILDPLFPESLLLNEIKSASIPFSFTSFKFTKRFENIMNDAGDDFILKARNFDDDIFYIAACTWILAVVHNYFIDLKRPFFFDIPDKNGELRTFKAAFNADMGSIVPTENAPEITEDDIIDSINQTVKLYLPIVDITSIERQDVENLSAIKVVVTYKIREGVFETTDTVEVTF